MSGNKSAEKMIEKDSKMDGKREKGGQGSILIPPKP